MVRIGRLAAVLTVLLGVAFAAPGSAAAHALLQTSDPAAGSTVASAPPVISLTFGEAPDPALSSAKVLDTSGRNVATGPAVAVAGRPLMLQVPVGALADGVYTVSWRTVSAVDGHTAVGSFAFGVGVAPGAGAAGGGISTSSPSAAPENVVARFVLLLGLVLLFGSGFIGAAVHPAPPRSLLRMAGVAWLLVAAGTIGVVSLQAIDAGSGVGAFLGSSLGAWAIRRVVLVAVAGIALGAVLRRTGGAGQWSHGLIAVAGAALMLIDVATGHAAATGLTTVQVAVQWVHVLAAGVWMGGLAGLLLSIRGAPSEDRARAVRRFSRWASVALGAIAVTGLVRAVQEVGTFQALTSTDFGRVVVIKSALVVILAVLGAINHFGSVPRAARTLAPLRRVGRTELVIGLVVLLATGLLVSLAPPASFAAAQAAPGPPPLTVSGSDFGTSVKVNLVIKPGTAGLNAFSAAVADYDSGAPVSAPSMTLRFELASATGVGGSSLVLPSTGPGAFAASGGNLSLDGIWSVVAVVAGSSGSVEVPLPLATRLAGQVVTQNVVTGLPTVYIAQLPAGDTLQLYLDPGTPGANELHATFFDAGGTELPVQAATFLVTPGSAAGTVIPGRKLEPGHFVVDLPLEAGALGVDVVGQAPTGATLHAHVDLSVAP